MNPALSGLRRSYRKYQQSERDKAALVALVNSGVPFHEKAIAQALKILNHGITKRPRALSDFEVDYPELKKLENSE